MRFISQLAALATVPLLVQAAPVTKTDSTPRKYIVLLEPSVNATTILSHHNRVREIHARNILARRDMSTLESSGLEFEYGFAGFHGYVGGFDNKTIEELQNMPEVLNVEEDSVMTTLGLQTQRNATWGLGSISSKTGKSNNYVYDSTSGANTYSYVIDTGIRITHNEFEGRATFGYNAVNNISTDSAGHGTHVAGIIGGKTYGVAKKTNLIAVKVFEGNRGTTSTVIQGFQWAVNDVIAKNRQKTAVLNLSLGGPGSTVWDAAITAASNAGVLAVVAAGNENQPASTRSPARSPEAVTVGNVQSDLKRYGGTTGSNYGPVVDIFAAGTGVISAYPTSDNATKSLTGTSMAAPHVAGLVSYLRGLEGPATAEVIKSRIYALAQIGRVTDLNESADRLAYNGNNQQ